MPRTFPGWLLCGVSQFRVAAPAGDPPLPQSSLPLKRRSRLAAHPCESAQMTVLVTLLGALCAPAEFTETTAKYQVPEFRLSIWYWVTDGLLIETA